MTRLTEAQLQACGYLVPTKQKPAPKPPKVRLSTVQWDAKTFPGGVWLQVPFVPPSLNEWKNWSPFKVNDFKKEMYRDVGWLKLAAKLPKYERATVQIVYYHRTNRRRDKVDNWAPKFLMDALVNGGILVDDNSDLVDVSVSMKFDAERPRTEVFVWERK